MNDSLLSMIARGHGPSLSYRNLCDGKKRVDIVEAGRLFYDFHFNEIGGSSNADRDSGNDDDLLSS